MEYSKILQILHVILTSIGLSINSYALYAITRQRMKSHKLYLVDLCMNNILLLFAATFIKFYKPHDVESCNYSKIASYVTSAFVIVNSWIIVFYSYDRYNNIERSRLADGEQRSIRCCLAIIVGATVAALLWSGRTFLFAGFYEVHDSIGISYNTTNQSEPIGIAANRTIEELRSKNTKKVMCTVMPDWLSIARVTNILDTFIALVIPAIAIATCDFKIAKKVFTIDDMTRRLHSDAQIQQRKSVGWRLIVTSLLYVFVNAPSYVFRIVAFELDPTDTAAGRDWLHNVQVVCGYLHYFNCTLDVILYVYWGNAYINRQRRRTNDVELVEAS